jgi:hypothetical protein
LTDTPGRGYEVERMRPLAPCLAAALLVAGGRAAAALPSVTLNGVAIDGVTSQRFESCTVEIDERGNIHIHAKGYAVKGAEQPRPAGSPGLAGAGVGLAGRAGATGTAPQVTRRYFIVTEQTPPGTQYDLGVFINTQWIRDVKASELQAVMEITRYLRPGANKITLAATKRIAGERLAFTRDVALKVVVGEGNVGADHVVIDVPLLETARTAAELDDRTEEFVIDAR